jgi:hypothetical protein
MDLFNIYRTLSHNVINHISECAFQRAASQLTDLLVLIYLTSLLKVIILYPFDN